MRANPWRGLAGLRREIWVIFATMLINRLGTMALPFLVLYLTRDLGFSAGKASLAVTVYGGVALVVSPLAGRLCDRIGALRIMKASLLTSGAMLLAYPFVRSYPGVLAATALWALTNEAFRPANMALLTHLATPEQRKPAFALNRLAVNMGMSVGPAVGGVLAMISFRWLFWVDAFTSILAGLLLIFLTWHRLDASRAVERGPQPEPGETALSRSGLTNGRFLFFLLALMPAVLVFFQLNSAFSLFMVRDLKLSESAFGLMFTVNTVLIILIEIPLNTAMARWPHRRALALGTLLTGIGFGALVFASGVWGVAATVVVWTFGEMITFPGSSAAVADMSPPDRRGEYMGLYTMSFGIAFALGPWLGTVVLARFGAHVLWPCAFLLGGLSAVLMTQIRTPDPGGQPE